MSSRPDRDGHRQAAVSSLRVQYPDVYAAMNSGCRLSLRNHVRKQIMAALGETDAEQIEDRLAERARRRRTEHTAWDGIRQATGEKR